MLLKSHYKTKKGQTPLSAPHLLRLKHAKGEPYVQIAWLNARFEEEYGCEVHIRFLQSQPIYLLAHLLHLVLGACKANNL